MILKVESVNTGCSFFFLNFTDVNEENGMKLKTHLGH